ncbi:hypothetical protein P9265_19550 [Schinkia azotoformans]|nr:hypothetical protein [Schinkia azotoformans]
MQDHFEQIIYRIIANFIVELVKNTVFKPKKQKNKRSKKRKK